MNKNFNEGAVERPATGSKSRSVNHFDAITRRYRDLYKKCWYSHTTDVKKKALERAISEKATATYTRDVFLQEFARRVDLLLDSRHFCEAVKGLIPPLDPYAVATHIVVLGWKELEHVLLHGGYKDLRPYEEWKDPILTMEDLGIFFEHPVKELLEAKVEKAG